MCVCSASLQRTDPCSTYTSQTHNASRKSRMAYYHWTSREASKQHQHSTHTYAPFNAAYLPSTYCIMALCPFFNFPLLASCGIFYLTRILHVPYTYQLNLCVMHSYLSSSAVSVASFKIIWPTLEVEKPPSISAEYHTVIERCAIWEYRGDPLEKRSKYGTREDKHLYIPITVG